MDAQSQCPCPRSLPPEDAARRALQAERAVRDQREQNQDGDDFASTRVRSTRLEHAALVQLVHDLAGVRLANLKGDDADVQRESLQDADLIVD